MESKSSIAASPPLGVNRQSSIKKGPRPKHVPQRTCIACRSHDAKRGLVRIVRTPSGTVEVDETGKKNGRGAYLCRTRECWETGLARKALENALKVPIDPENRARLKSFGESLPGRSAVEVD
jgi:predicted RNA-binding protein YlxR (DUF448 family)